MVEKAAAGKFSGRTMDVVVSMRFNDLWRSLSGGYEFVKKWSGGCFKDVSSGVGGYCLLEENDTNMDGFQDSFLRIYGTDNDVDNVTNR